MNLSLKCAEILVLNDIKELLLTMCLGRLFQGLIVVRKKNKKKHLIL